MNPLLERLRLPGGSYRLPSGGLFYTKDEIDFETTVGEVHVYPMTTLDEITLQSPDKLINGTAVLEVFQRCIPEIKQPNALFAKDVDYLMLALREVTFGPTMELEYKHTCENAKSRRYDINIAQIISEARNIDPTTIQSLYVMEMQNGQKVHLQPMRFKNVVDALMEMKPNEEWEQPEEYRLKLLKVVSTGIVQVDDITDKDQIFDWIKAIPITWYKQIAKVQDTNSSWGPSNQFKTKCQDCGEDIEIEVSLNPVSFFI